MNTNEKELRILINKVNAACVSMGVERHCEF